MLGFFLLYLGPTFILPSKRYFDVKKVCGRLAGRNVWLCAAYNHSIFCVWLSCSDLFTSLLFVALRVCSQWTVWVVKCLPVKVMTTVTVPLTFHGSCTPKPNMDLPMWSEVWCAWSYRCGLRSEVPIVLSPPLLKKKTTKIFLWKVWNRTSQ